MVPPLAAALAAEVLLDDVEAPRALDVGRVNSVLKPLPGGAGDGPEPEQGDDPGDGTTILRRLWLQRPRRASTLPGYGSAFRSGSEIVHMPDLSPAFVRRAP